jgi:hypothetical protein
MKALVATKATQGTRRNDSMDCVEGELVWMLDACPASKRNPDGRCDCGRTFMGMSSQRLTTTARVRDIPWLTRDNYAAALRACFDAHGWCPCCTRRPVLDVIDSLMALAGILPVGAVVGRRLDHLNVREQMSPGGGDAA